MAAKTTAIILAILFFIQLAVFRKTRVKMRWFLSSSMERSL